MEFITPIILVLIGLAIAFTGRKLLWLLIAAAGFVIAFELTSGFLGESALSLIISIGVGVVAGYYATRFTQLLINLAGFILIGNAALTTYGLFFTTDKLWLSVLIFVIGGFIGVGLIRFAFDIAVILISSLGGASMVIQGAAMLTPSTDTTVGFFDRPLISTLVALVVVVAGFVYQYRAWKSEPS